LYLFALSSKTIFLSPKERVLLNVGCNKTGQNPLSKGRGAGGEGSIRTLHVFEYEMEIEIAYFKIDPSLKIVPFRIQLKDNFSLSLGESPNSKLCKLE